jgi:hypothetical protein
MQRVIWLTKSAGNARAARTLSHTNSVLVPRTLTVERVRFLTMFPYMSPGLGCVTEKQLQFLSSLLLL